MNFFVNSFLKFVVSRSKMNKQKTLFVLLLIISLAVVKFNYAKLFQIFKLNEKCKNEKKTVLIYSRYDEKNPRWGKIPVTHVMKREKSEDCPYVNCIFTHDHNYLKKIEDFDAIIFQRNHNLNWKPPAKRNQHQLYIMKNHEL